ncbi:uncharacterized protein LOC124170811 [Ischnura elegans]|uniref:uncharacterized protein LOC124170811 n=1 Tax=Ischnura elegans TaxID=197161 RepID=UPI001ED8824C|nr:uncharacterized protein LOC124170811 [Ischnura elegans]
MSLPHYCRQRAVVQFAAYPMCAGYVPVKENRARGRGPSSLCLHCNLARKQMCDRKRRQQVFLAKKKYLKVALTKCRVKAARLSTKVSDLKKHMEELRVQTSAKSADILEAEVASLPVAQQEAITACFESSKRVNSKGRRYTNNWVYECILLRIKSPKAYEHLRSHGILALPSAQTLRRYFSTSLQLLRR